MIYCFSSINILTILSDVVVWRGSFALHSDPKIVNIIHKTFKSFYAQMIGVIQIVYNQILHERINRFMLRLSSCKYIGLEH